jgi:branched-chain amino acid transport system permease protein
MNDFWLTFAQLTVNGIAVGAIYALVALGIVLIYKATEVLNFAHGDLLVVSAFSAWGLITVWGLPFWAWPCLLLRWMPWSFVALQASRNLRG